MSRRSTPVLVILAALLLLPTLALQAASTPYIVSIVDRDSWVQADTVSPFTYADVGDTATVCVWVDPATGAEDYDGGFDFLIRYDAYVMTLLSVTRGPDLAADWEYFNYRADAGDSCAGCPSGLVRLVGVGDIAGGSTPPDPSYNLAGCVAELSFIVGQDVSQQGLCHQIDFYSINCSDNVISSRGGDSMFVPAYGIVPDPSFDSTACPGTYLPYINYTSGQLCIGSGSEPPDTLMTPYQVGIIDRDAWVLSDSVVPVTAVDGGSDGTMCLWVNPGTSADKAEGGFDFLVSFDASAMILASVMPGSDLPTDWEYFTYRTLTSDSCSGCPGGLLRVVGLCDIGDGTTPAESSFNLSGCVAEVTFIASSNPADAGCHPLGFFSIDCGDNAISSRLGDSLFLPLSGVTFAPTYDPLGCAASGYPLINFVGGLWCINGGNEPPDTLVAPYLVGMVNRDAWETADSLVPVTTVDGGGDGTFCLWVGPDESLGRAESGFDFLVRYNAYAMTLSSVVRGSDLAVDWEYFSYRTLTSDSCGGCPEGLLRIVGVCDVSDGSTPAESSFDLSGCIAEITFTASANPVAAGCHPIEFFSMDCGDNVMVSRFGDSLFLPLVGHIPAPTYDPLGCAASGYPVINFLTGVLCINGGNEPPDTVVTPYEVRIIDPAAWYQGHVVEGATFSAIGQNAKVGLWIDPASGGAGDEGGFDFLLGYDPTGLTFISANRGADLHPDWEYFTWRTLSSPDTCGGVSEQLIRLIGIANMLNSDTPPDEAYQVSGCIAELTFFVSGDGGTFSACQSIGFCGLDCSDNALTNRDGNTLYIPLSGVQYCDGFDPASCISDTLESAIPAINYVAGAICIDGSNPGHGDLNLNGIQNEIGDLVLYDHFFWYGPSVFQPATIDQQIAESEVNCDGATLTTVDWVYMANIITGNLPPCNLVSSARRPSGGGLAAGVSQTPSVLDTVKVINTATAAGNLFMTDMYIRNVDTLGAFSLRLRYDPTQIVPVTDSAGALDVQLIRGGGFEDFGGSIIEPGVVTLFAADFDLYAADAFVPGGGTTIRMIWRALPTATDTMTVVAFENDPVYPHTYNTFADIHASVHKRPVLINGLVSIGGSCQCSGTCDYDEDGFLTSVDMGMMIDVLFAGEPEQQEASCPMSCGDYDGDFQTTALDLADLIDHLFAGKPGPTNPCSR